ncbi:MAG: VPLPA-CTERM sorting domain-containing protein, partial [Desulfobacula sp.]
NLIFGDLNTAGTIVGSWGEGEFNQDGGKHTVRGLTDETQADLIVGANSSVTGTYNLNFGELFVMDENNASPWNHISYIGYNGIGIFNLGAAAHYAGEVIIGYADSNGMGPSGAYGEYNLNSVDSSLTARQIVIGGKFSNGDLPGYGTLNQNDGYVETEHLRLADSIGSEGTYNLYNGNLFVSGHDVIGAAGMGIFNQYGGSHISDDFIAIGTAGIGLYNLEDGFLSSNNIFVGESNVGEFNQSGGAHHVGMEIDVNTGNPIPKAGLHELIVARKGGSTGKYFLSGGELHAAREIIGDQGFGSASQGEFRQSGSSRHTIYQDLIIGQDPMSVGLFTLSHEAQLTVLGNIFLGDEAGNGTFEQDGGSVTIDQGLYISSSSESGNNPGHGSYKLTGGSLTADTIVNSGLFTGMADENYLTVTNGFINYGVVAPGQSPGSLTITGDYTQDPIGTLLIELGGYIQGMDYDYLNITGSATLAGILEVTLWDGFNPQNGDFFDILQAGNITGEFDFNQLIMPKGWSGEIAYLDLDGNTTIDTVRLTANAVPLPNAIWLLSSGLIGIIGIRRKTNS